MVGTVHVAWAATNSWLYEVRCLGDGVGVCFYVNCPPTIQHTHTDHAVVAKGTQWGLLVPCNTIADVKCY